MLLPEDENCSIQKWYNDFIGQKRGSRKCEFLKEMSVRLIIIVKGNFLPFYNLLEIASVKNARKAILKSSTWKYDEISI